MIDIIEEKVGLVNGNAIEAINITKASEIMTHNLTNVDVIGIDEVQFFDDEIVVLVEKLSATNTSCMFVGKRYQLSGD